MSKDMADITYNSVPAL